MLSSGEKVKFKNLLFITFVLVFFNSLIIAQQPQATPQKVLKLAKVEFKGLQKLKQEKLMEELNLQIGQTITPEMVDEAAARLNNSGRFTNFKYRFSTSGEQASVIFEFEETKSVIHVVFDNFIWFTEEDLWLGVKKDVPSFDGTAPESGDETERIRKSLERLLKEKNIEGRVEHAPSANESGGNPKHIFSVKGIKITPCRVRFAGAVAVDEKELISNSKELLKGEYSKTFVEDFANANLKPLYRKIGHLRVKFTNVTARPADEAVCNGVIVSIKVEEGNAYTWDGAVWANNLSLSSKELDAAIGMTTGEIADGTKIDKGFAAIKKAYSRKGYLTVRFKTEEDFDDDTKKVSYHINVSEGVQFRMGTLTIKGLPDDVIPRLQEKWKLKSGDVYDDLYVNEFIDTVLVKETSLQLLMRSNSKIKQYMTITPNAKTSTVDVTIEFKE